jgi:hypothetical protein
LFDPDNLRPGDVVLEIGSHWTSYGIQIANLVKTATWSRYSHALIFLGGTIFLEAVDIGARKISFARVPIEDQSTWVVLRHLDEEIAKRAAKEARNLAHKEYGLAAAWRSQLPFRVKDDPTRIFCSQLVAEAYQRAGAALVQGKEPWQITPGLLHKCSVLKQVQPLPIHKPPARYVPARDRDAAYIDSLNAEELNVFQNVFNAIQPELTCLIDAHGVRPKPGALGDIFPLLVAAEAQRAPEVSRLMQAFEQVLERERFFDLYPTFASKAEAGLLTDLNYAKSEQANDSERAYLGRRAAWFCADYVDVLSTWEKSARYFQNASETSSFASWSRLARLSRDAAGATQKLITLARAVSEQCASISLSGRVR